MNNRPAFLVGTVLVFAALIAPSPEIFAARSGPPSIGAPGDEDRFRWSPLIRDAQNFLIEFGLMAGPSDGRMGPETKRAVRTYQRINGLSEDGEVSVSLVNHMGSVGRPGSLKKRLEKARQEQSKQARHALLSSPATRDLLVRNTISSDNTAAKRDIAACLRAPNSDCLLDEALYATDAIARDDYRDWALREVIRTQARAGAVSDMRNSIRRLTDVRLIMVSLREAVTGLIAAGRHRDAKRVAESIPDDWNRARALAAVIAEQGGKEFDKSIYLKLLTLLPELKDKIAAVEIAANLAANLAAHDDRDAAPRLLQSTLDSIIATIEGNNRQIALGIVAGAYARIGWTERALSLLRNIGELGRDHVALAEAAGQFARQRLPTDALSIANRLRTPQLFVLALSNIASAQSALGNQTAAQSTLTRAMSASLDIERPFAVDSALARIASVWSRLPDFEHAYATAAKIKSRALRARTIWKIAAAGGGDSAAFDSRAYQATDAVESPFDRAIVLTRAAVLMAQNRRSDDAKKLFAMALAEAKAVRTNWWRARIFSRLAIALMTVEL